jgi:hypothetical protein
MQSAANPRIQQVSFTVEGPSMKVARLMADTILVALNDLVVEVRRKRANAEREFLEKRFGALGDSLRAREDVLRQFYEQNRNLASPQLQFEEVRLRRDVDRVQNVYAQVGGQLEQARIQEVRDTPALIVVDPPIDPVRKSFRCGRRDAPAGLLAAASQFCWRWLAANSGRRRSRNPSVAA